MHFRNSKKRKDWKMFLHSRDSNKKVSLSLFTVPELLTRNYKKKKSLFVYAALAKREKERERWKIERLVVERGKGERLKEWTVVT